MLRANSLVRKAAVRPERVADTLGLAHRDRNRGGVTATTAGGLEIEIALDKPAVLNDGDALKLEDGRLVQVRAVPESLLAVRAGNPLRLTRLAWHLGGHHVPAEMTADALYVPNDPALAELVRGQGCAMTPVERPFQPEPEVHHHAHGDDCGCGHDHHGAGLVCETCGHAHAPDPGLLNAERFDLREAWSAIIAVGLRPCSGALLVMTFSLLNGLYLGGALSVLAMSFGTAITVSALATLAVTAKGMALRFAGNGAGAAWIGHGIELLGAVFVLLMGLLLLGASLQGGGFA